MHSMRNIKLAFDHFLNPSNLVHITNCHFDIIFIHLGTEFIQFIDTQNTYHIMLLY